VSLDSWIYGVDQYGVKNYRLTFLSLLAVLILYGAIGSLSPVLLWFELAATNGNIKTYGDAFWTLQMAASTIGFGDYYPVTFGGRLISALMFYLGVGLVGFIGALVADKLLGFADTTVKNRELREQNAVLLAHNRELERKIDKLLDRFEADIEQEKH